MTGMKRWMATLGLLLVAGCSSPAPTAAPTPLTRAVTVRIIDTVPLDIYFNVDNKVCKAQPFGEPTLTHGPQVTISDSAGKVLTSQDGPLVGGKNDDVRNSCTVDIEFPAVPASDVFVVQVKSFDGQTWDRTVQASADNPQVIEVQV